MEILGRRSVPRNELGGNTVMDLHGPEDGRVRVWLEVRGARGASSRVTEPNQAGNTRTIIVQCLGMRLNLSFLKVRRGWKQNIQQSSPAGGTSVD
jgi:hypothetical protein